MADNKPSLADSLKNIGKAITDEVEKHGGVQGLATETFEAAKTGAGKAIDALSKAADDASKYASAKSDEFQRKYNEYKNASNEEDKDTATDDAAVLAEMERQAKLDTEEAKLRARLAEIAEERKGGETK